MIDPLRPGVEHCGTVELRIPGQAEWVAVARLAVSAVANRLPFSLEEIEDLKLALAEACTNCIQHGGRENTTITIIFEVRVDAIRVIVRDHPAVLPTQDLRSMRLVATQLREERTESVGIYIIRSLVDTVDYRVDARTGTELVMTKYVHS